MRFDDITSMTDLEWCQAVVALSDAAMGGFSAEDFMVNPIQMKKLRDLVQFFMDRFEEFGGEFEDVAVNPLEPPNGVTVKFEVFDLSGDGLREFCNHLENCSAISMDVTDNKVCISCTIPGVFSLK